MRFLIDENIRSEVIVFLKKSEHDVQFVPRGAKDEVIAKIAKEEKRIILTHDIHFANILSFPPKQYSGIIRIRIHPPKAEFIINSLKNLVQKLPFSESFDKKLIILEKDDFRIR